MSWLLYHQINGHVQGAFKKCGWALKFPLLNKIPCKLHWSAVITRSNIGQNINLMLDPKKTPHTGTSPIAGELWGVFCVKIMKFDHVIMAPHCILLIHWNMIFLQFLNLRALRFESSYTFLKLRCIYFCWSMACWYTNPSICRYLTPMLPKLW